MNKYFYEKYDEFLEHPVNKTFEEVLWMTDDEFEQWVDEYCTVIVDIWDKSGQPPRVGLWEEDIINQFKKVESFSFKEFMVKDVDTQKEECIRNTSIIGNAVNQWFPTMMKTRINYTSDVNGGKSIYDHFKDPKLRKKMVTYGRRHFKRDSFYHYSNPLRVFVSGKTDPKKYMSMFYFVADNALDWIRRFEEKERPLNPEWDYWIEPAKPSVLGYTGYGSDVKDVSWHTITEEELNRIKHIIPEQCMTVVADKDTELYRLRVFKKGQKIFPAGIKAFRISVCQYAVNFPPLTAKFLYERYTQHIDRDKIYIWDPSAGWAGRLLGAMGIKDRENSDGEYITHHYIGTDPNTDHNTTPGRTKYHEVADFYNRVKSIGVLPFDIHNNTYEIYQCGSEVMREQKEFHKYKGLIDVVMTSPPYFAKELYSEDPEQSARKFSQFDSWVEGFLYPTLETASEWLRPGGYLIWNIADAKFGSMMMPLEEKSVKFVTEKCGLEHVETLKMLLAQMPGGNRTFKTVDEDGNEIEKGRAKNVCRVAGANKTGKVKTLWFKYEPIFVFRKKE